MKAEELRGLAVEELTDKLTSLKKSLMEFRFQSKTGKLETKNSIKSTRRDVARIMTVLSQLKRVPAAQVKSETVKKQKPVKAAAVKKAAVKKTVAKKSVKTSKK